MTRQEVADAIEMIARDPHCGDLLPGTSGIRKVRFATAGRGKSGSVRIVYHFHSAAMPILLLSVFAKNEKDNLTRAERITLAKVAKALRDSYGA